MSRIFVRLAAFAALNVSVLAVGTVSALAQERTGLSFSIQTGVADVRRESAKFRGSFVNFTVGRMADDKTNWQAEVGFGESTAVIPVGSAVFAGVALQRWLVRPIWIRAGAGFGATTFNPVRPDGMVGLGDTHAGWQASGAAGLELRVYEFRPQDLHGHSLVFDLQYQHRMVMRDRQTSHVTAIVIGFNVYRR